MQEWGLIVSSNIKADQNLNTASESKLQAIIIGKRKREMGIIVLTKYFAMTKTRDLLKS